MKEKRWENGKCPYCPIFSSRNLLSLFPATHPQRHHNLISRSDEREAHRKDKPNSHISHDYRQNTTMPTWPWQGAHVKESIDGHHTTKDEGECVRLAIQSSMEKIRGKTIKIQVGKQKSRIYQSSHNLNSLISPKLGEWQNSPNPICVNTLEHHFLNFLFWIN